MPTLYFVRHAESEANEKQEYAGHLSIPLTAKGKFEAEHTSFNFCKNHDITKIICSPIYRAQQTAGFFAEKVNLPIITEELLQEQDMGEYSGKAYAYCESLSTFEPIVGKRWYWAPPKGETYEQVANRACSFLSEMQKLTATEKVLVVTHGVFLRLMRGALENTLPIFYTGLTKNCEIYKTNFTKLNQRHIIESIYFGEPDTKIHRE
mgnify:FL=1